MGICERYHGRLRRQVSTHSGRARYCGVYHRHGVIFIGILTAALTAAFMKPTEEELAQQIEEDNERVAKVVQEQILAHLTPIQAQLAEALELLRANNIPVTAELPPAILATPEAEAE